PRPAAKRTRTLAGGGSLPADRDGAFPFSLRAGAIAHGDAGSPGSAGRRPYGNGFLAVGRRVSRSGLDAKIFDSRVRRSNAAQSELGQMLIDGVDFLVGHKQLAPCHGLFAAEIG